MSYYSWKGLSWGECPRSNVAQPLGARAIELLPCFIQSDSIPTVSVIWANYWTSLTSAFLSSNRGYPHKHVVKIKCINPWWVSGPEPRPLIVLSNCWQLVIHWPRYYNTPKYTEWKSIFPSSPPFPSSLLPEVKKNYLNNQKVFLNDFYWASVVCSTQSLTV